MNESIIRLINSFGKKIAFNVTGGGTSFIGKYLNIPGGSSTIYDFYVPYNQEAFNKLIGKEIEKYNSFEAANELALAANNKADIRVGLTASVIKENEREGRENSFYLSIYHLGEIWSWKHILDKNVLKTRELQEDFICHFVLSVLHDFCEGVVKENGYGCTSSFFILPNRKYFASYGKIKDFYILNHNYSFGAFPKFVYPGSFNPFHSGHNEILKIVTNDFCSQVYLEISTQIVGKPDLSEDEAENRLRGTRLPFIVSKSKMFYEKASLYGRGTVFIVGLDTFERIFNPLFYKNYDEFTDCLLGWVYDNIKFIVFNRGVGGTIDLKKIVVNYLTYGDFVLKFYEDFNMDVSSTQIRREIAK